MCVCLCVDVCVFVCGCVCVLSSAQSEDSPLRPVDLTALDASQLNINDILQGPM